MKAYAEGIKKDIKAESLMKYNAKRMGVEETFVNQATAKDYKGTYGQIENISAFLIKQLTCHNNVISFTGKLPLQVFRSYLYKYKYSKGT